MLVVQDIVADFRPSRTTLSASVVGMALVLCNDRAETFGAPDVLEICADRLSLQLCTDRQIPDRPPNQASRVALRFWAGFLNNNASRWEPILDSWEATAELVDRCSPIFRSDHQR